MNFKNILIWLQEHNIYSLKFYKSKPMLKRWLAIFFTSFISVLLIASITIVSIANFYLGKIERNDISHEDAGVSKEAMDLYAGQDVINIMLFGIDSRSMKEESRSDAMILLTVDKKHNKIKLTSIARDTYVPIEGYGNDKLTHAFIYGWVRENNIVGGAKLALKTINSAFNLNVSDYITANFWAVAKIVDFLGGVDIDVTSTERHYINNNYIPYMNEIGLDCEPVSGTGMQHLTGGQAVAYCRLRFDSDVTRGERQREVLTAMFEDLKKMNATKYPELISLILKECTTSLSNGEIMSIGTWALANIGSIKIEMLGLPTKDIDKGGTMMNGIWYYTYDIEAAAKKIEEFILETNQGQ